MAKKKTAKTTAKKSKATKTTKSTKKKAESVEESSAKKKTKKKAVKKKKKAAKKKRASRKKKNVAVRQRLFWGVFNHAMKRVALYEFNQKKAADKRAKELTDSGKPPHFVMKVKEPVEEAKESA